MKRTSGLVCLLALSPLPYQRASEHVPTAAGLSVVSLNLAREADVGKILSDLRQIQAVRDADLFLFQEVPNADGAPNGVAGELARALNLNVAFAPAAPRVYDQGLAILSRYPIRGPRICSLKKCDLRFRSRSRFALGVTIDAPEGPVRVWNVHLDTRINAATRLEQLAPVLDEAAAWPGPKIIGGDFNTNNFYWLGNVVPVPWAGGQTGAVRRFMYARGFVAPHQPVRPTFDYLGMHLDWIFQSDLAAAAASVHPVPFSDHHALLVRFAGQ